MKHALILSAPTMAPPPVAAWRSWAVAAGTITLLVVPSLTLATVSILVILQTTLLVICNLPATRRTMAAPRARRAASRGPAGRLSVHIAARNEPPDVLIPTLETLRQQVRVPEYEVVVIINNTPSPELWQPIEDWCNAAGLRFRLVRRDNVTGAKAGALNIALEQTGAAISHIVVLDADYQVVPEFLAMIDEELRATGADFLQFPQAYRHVSPRTNGLSCELAEYFDRHARAANVADAMLLTGTLSVIGRDALVAVGGWPSRSCTEDAELGTRLIAAGFRGVFIDRVVGRGLMPLDLRNLHRQRHRWAAGNARVLIGVLRRWLGTGRGAGAGLLQRLLVVAQLAAWLNLGAVAVVTLIVGVVQAGIGRLTGNASAVPDATILFSAATMVLILIAAAYPVLHGIRPPVPVSVRFQALASRLSMVPIAACATIAGTQSRSQEFRITAKICPGSGAAGVDMTLLVTASLGALLILIAAFWRDPVVALAGMLMLLPPVGGLAIRAPLSRYAADVAERRA